MKDSQRGWLSTELAATLSYPTRMGGIIVSFKFPQKYKNRKLK